MKSHDRCNKMQNCVYSVFVPHFLVCINIFFIFTLITTSRALEYAIENMYVQYETGIPFYHSERLLNVVT